LLLQVQHDAQSIVQQQGLDPRGHANGAELAFIEPHREEASGWRDESIDRIDETKARIRLRDVEEREARNGRAAKAVVAEPEC